MMLAFQAHIMQELQHHGDLCQMPLKPSGQATCGRIRFLQREAWETIHEALKVKLYCNKDYRILKMLKMWDEEKLQALSRASPRENADAQQRVSLEEWVYLSLLFKRGHLKFQVPDMELQELFHCWVLLLFCSGLSLLFSSSSFWNGNVCSVQSHTASV